MNYTMYHLHSDYSLLDSCTNYKEYIDYAVSLRQKAIAFTEHGKPMGWVAKKKYCDEKGIKYIHGVECYLTEKLLWDNSEKIRDNYHTILIAKNFKGLLEINELISRSTDKDHTYYHNRVSFDEFLQLSNNIITISACLASPLNKLDINNPMYEKLVKRYDYLEIQSHNCQEQKDFNTHLAIMSNKYHKPLIVGTDTHSLNKYKAECRKILLKYKDRSYGDEDKYDLTYQTYDELVNAFIIQDTLPKNIYLQAIENTNVMADSIEDFELDKSLKYPILYGTREKDKEMFHKTIEDKFKHKVENNIIYPEQVEAFKSAIEEEKRVLNKIEMDGFMLSMSELLSWCHDNNIPVGNARGSVGGSRVAYITDIIDLNPETWHTVFSRFANESRKEVGDIDIDVISSDRPKIFEYIISRFGTKKTARVPSFGTMVDNGTIDGICNALDKYWHEENGKGESPYSLSQAKKIKAKFAEIITPYRKINEEINKIKDDISLSDKLEELTIKRNKLQEKLDRLRNIEYPKVFYYFDGLINTKMSQSVHPAGMVISPITLTDNYGVFHKDDDLCLMIDMEEVHEIGLVKYDFLILKTVGIINDTYKMINKPYPKSHEINWYDEKVWEDMIRNPTGIFQMEGEYAHSLLRQYKPHSIFDMSLVTAAIRPSGASYRDTLMKKIPNKNPSEIIDNLLKDNLGYLVYQEDVIAFLQQICGLNGSDADNIRRAIGRKDKDRLQKALPQILEGYCNKSNKSRAIAEEEANMFLKIIEDASSYMFGYNHSIAYCLIGYMCAYLRYYHPYEFITSYLNNAANEDDIADGTTLANEYKVTITPPKFGISKDVYALNKENKIIAKGISSVKFLNAKAGIDLFELSKSNLNSFTDVLYGITKTSCLNSRQLSILINVDYFSSFGNVRELSKISEVFDNLKNGEIQTIKQEKLESLWYKDIIKKYATNLNDKGKELKTWRILDAKSILYECEEQIKSLNISDISLKVKMQNQKEYLGYIDLTTGKEEDRRKLIVMDVIPLKNKETGISWAYAIITRSIGSGKSSRLTLRAKIYDQDPIKEMNVIYAKSVEKNNKGYWYLIDYSLIE